VRRAIEEHLAQHPHAADSAAGVARWWVEARGVHASADAVRRVLAELVAAGAVRQVTLPDGTVLYSKGR
jgi:Fe2+ or Zn2+ uptake regulation protein